MDLNALVHWVRCGPSVDLRLGAPLRRADADGEARSSARSEPPKPSRPQGAVDGFQEHRTPKRLVEHVGSTSRHAGSQVLHDRCKKTSISESAEPEEYVQDRKQTSNEDADRPDQRDR
jgi:hypothetical protein